MLNGDESRWIVLVARRGEGEGEVAVYRVSGEERDLLLRDEFATTHQKLSFRMWQT